MPILLAEMANIRSQSSLHTIGEDEFWGSNPNLRSLKNEVDLDIIQKIKVVIHYFVWNTQQFCIGDKAMKLSWQQILRNTFVVIILGRNGETRNGDIFGGRYKEKETAHVTGCEKIHKFHFRGKLHISIQNLYDQG